MSGVFFIYTHPMNIKNKNLFLFSLVLLLVLQNSCMKLPASKLAKCIPPEYSSDYILLIQENSNRNKNNSIDVSITRNGNTSSSNGTYVVSSYGLNMERQVKKYFKGRYELMEINKKNDDDSKISKEDSSFIKYPVAVYRFVLKEGIRRDNKGIPIFYYYLYDRKEFIEYSPVRRYGTHLFAPILRGLNDKMKAKP